MLRISNVGQSTYFNFRIQNHSMKLVEIEGSHIVQNMYDSNDVHVGQSIAVLVTLDKPPKDYQVIASTRFTDTNIQSSTGILHYSNSNSPVSGPLPSAPTLKADWSMMQAKTFRRNLTANAARPNPQGSYHYGNVTRTRSLVFANSAQSKNGKLRYAVNDVYFDVPDTPLKLADHLNIGGIFSWDSIASQPRGGQAVLGTPVVRFNLHNFVEIVFRNTENTIQTFR